MAKRSTACSSRVTENSFCKSERSAENAAPACGFHRLKPAVYDPPLVAFLSGFTAICFHYLATRVAIMRKSMLVSLIMVGMAVACTASVWAADDEVLAVDFTDCPSAVQKTLTEESRGAEMKQVDKAKTDDGEVYYEVEVEIRKRTYKIVVESDGTLWDKFLIVDFDEAEIGFSECPEPVQKTFQEEGKDHRFKMVNKVTDDDKITYHATAKLSAKEYEIIVAHDGTLISKTIAEDEEE